ncbi:MAG TPA: agmatine deiminase family protein [Bacillota bacterium]|jgi:agmatine deiminase|nr:agmatine deiminase family protein [Bacillota bacterium]HOL09392.1 agmatine deiminase family protein [Bacillota bacterium]HPO97116.1 agmatine deiminase family protein [Bacillota bacterium]
MFPAELGFKMPPEWYQHQRTIMEWPVKEAIWPEPFHEILPAYANIVNTIAQFEPVTLIVNPHLQAEAASYCKAKNIEILPFEHNDSWARDNGPTIVSNQNDEIAGINWTFNGWGNKYAADKDNQVAPFVLERLKIPTFNIPIVMEGGSFHTDGEGTLLTTEECLLNSNRNPNFTKTEIETYLKKCLNVSKIIWLKHGWVGDDTDGHIDNVACFAWPGVVIKQVCLDPNDPNYQISQENLEILQNATDAQGRKLEIIEIEQPPATYYEDFRLTLSYLNFYFVNGGIIVPVFGNADTDSKAVATLRRVFPERKVVPIEGLTIARGGGNIHCLTQQIPAGQPAKL